MNLTKLRKIIRIFLIAISVVALAWIINKNFVFSGQMEAEYNFDKTSPFISVLKPAGRALKIERDASGDYFQRIIIEPVYFDLYMPAEFNKAKFTFIYEASEGRGVKVGPQVSGSDWNYKTKELACDNKYGDWCVAELKFDLTSVFRDEKKINFIISSSGLDKSGEEIKITKIRAILNK